MAHAGPGAALLILLPQNQDHTVLEQHFHEACIIRGKRAFSAVLLNEWKHYWLD